MKKELSPKDIEKIQIANLEDVLNADEIATMGEDDERFIAIYYSSEGRPYLLSDGTQVSYFGFSKTRDNQLILLLTFPGIDRTQWKNSTIIFKRKGDRWRYSKTITLSIGGLPADPVHVNNSPEEVIPVLSAAEQMLKK